MSDILKVVFNNGNIRNIDLEYHAVKEGLSEWCIHFDEATQPDKGLKVSYISHVPKELNDQSVGYECRLQPEMVMMAFTPEERSQILRVVYQGEELLSNVDGELVPLSRLSVLSLQYVSADDERSMTRWNLIAKISYELEHEIMSGNNPPSPTSVMAMVSQLMGMSTDLIAKARKKTVEGNDLISTDESISATEDEDEDEGLFFAEGDPIEVID